MPRQSSVWSELEAAAPPAWGERLQLEAPTMSKDPAGSGDRVLQARFHGHSQGLDVAGVAHMLDGMLCLTELCVWISPENEPAPGSREAGWGATNLRSPRAGDRITVKRLYDLRLGVLIDRVRAELLARDVFDRLAPKLGFAVDPKLRAHDRRVARALRRGVKPGGRPRLSDAHLRNVAETALRFQAHGVRSVRRTLADHFVVEEDTVRDWLRRCRDTGWLAPTSQGVRTVYPGERLLAAWKGEQRGN
jgi:hypothetical protein